MMTAGIMGMVKTFRYILITPSLIRFAFHRKRSTPSWPMKSVISRKNICCFYLFLLAGFFVIAYAIFLLISYFFILFPNALQILLKTGITAPTAFSVFYNTIFVLSFIFYFRYVFGFFMRNFERQADIYVFQLFDSAIPLMTSLSKIAISSGLSPDKPNWHHFSIKERIQFLEKMRNRQDLDLSP